MFSVYSQGIKYENRSQIAGEVATFLFYYPKRSQLDLRNFVAPQIEKLPFPLLFETDILILLQDREPYGFSKETIMGDLCRRHSVRLCDARSNNPKSS